MFGALEKGNVRTLKKRGFKLKKSDLSKVAKFKVPDKNKQRKKILKGLLYFVLVALLLNGVVFFTPLFDVQGVRVEGALHSDVDSILDVLNIKIGENWYKTVGFAPRDWVSFRLTNAQKHLVDNFSYIEEVTVSYRPLGDVVVMVEEREPEFLVLKEDKYLVLDKRGVFLEVVEPIDRPRLPVLEGLTVQNLQLGELIDFEEPYVLENLKRFMQIRDARETSSEGNVLDYVTALDFSKLDLFSFELEDRIEVIFLNVEELTQYRINFLTEIFYNDLSNEERGVLDFTLGDSRGVLFRNRE